MSWNGFNVHDFPGWIIFAIPVVGFIVIVLLAKLAGRVLPGAVKDQGKPLRPVEKNVGCLIAFGGVFALAGLAALFFITIQPTYRSALADRWPTTQGHVVSSAMGVSQDSDGGDTYRIDIHYTYTVNGRPYESNQYDSSGTHTYSGYRAAKQAVINAHPPGTAVVVHYDPADPADAMLSTALPQGTISFVWFPLIFIGVGIAIPFFGIRTARQAGRATPAKAVPIARTDIDGRGARRRNLIAILVFTLFWNGFITLFYFLSGGTWCLLPFALVGVGMIAFTGYTAMQLFNPVVAVRFPHMPLRPGERCEITYALSGNFLALRSLSFFVEGREKVTYRQGTDTRSETHVAWRVPLLETTSNAQFERGKFTLAMPADVMTSFVAPNNQFTWHLCCRGDIPGRPDIKDDFDVTVLSGRQA